MTIERSQPGEVPLEYYVAELGSGIRTFSVTYGGTIHHPIESYGKEQARGFSHTPGIISPEGVYLSASSYWYPVIDDALMNFTLEVSLPSGRDAVSQGRRTDHIRGDKSTRVKWESPEPQDEIFLIATRFTEYAEQAGKVKAMAFLRTPDRDLARKYLDATARYVGMYEKLIGPWKFSVVM